MIPDFALLGPDGAAVDLGTGPLGWEIPRWLSRQPLKQKLYGMDLYFREGWEEICTAAKTEDRLRSWLDDHTLILLKPDAVVRRRLEVATAWLKASGIGIVAAEPVHATGHLTKALWEYQWNIATRDRLDVSELMMRQGDGLLLVVRMPTGGTPAAVRMSALKGPANPAEQSPHHLRRALGTVNYIINGVHTPDEPADVVRELSVLLTAEQRSRVYEALAAGSEADPGPAIRHCHAQSPPEADLNLSARRHRWQRDVAALRPEAVSTAQRALLADCLADEGTVDRDWRVFADTMADVCPVWTDWDTVVLGTSCARAHIGGVERVLPGVPASDWLDRPEG